MNLREKLKYWNNLPKTSGQYWFGMFLLACDVAAVVGLYYIGKWVISA